MFQFISANSAELLREVYRIRYQAYCIENKYEAPNPSGLERDEYDDHSVHGLLVDCASRTPVGTVRLVMHKPGALRGSLPFHQVCKQPEVQQPDFLPYETTAEFSRFAISKTFRRGVPGGACEAIAADAWEGRSVIPHITIGLIAAALQLCFANRLTHVCAVMEPTLLRLMSRFGVHFQPVGPRVHYHGWRQPCCSKLATLMSGIERERHDVWEMVTENGQLWPATPGDCGIIEQILETHRTHRRPVQAA